MSDARRARRTTLADVAARAGVSRATASRALVDDRRISQRTRASVREAATALQYVPNVAARSLRARQTLTLGLLLPDLGDPVHAQVASGFELAAADEGYTVVFVAGMNSLESERRAMTVFAERSTDGVCVVSSVLDPSEVTARTSGSALVMVQPDHESMARVAASLPPGVICTDDVAGVREAALHLVSGGRRDICYLGSGERASNDLRRRTLDAVLRTEAGLEPRLANVSDDAWRAPRTVAEALGPRLPDAVVCYDDKLALALMDGLRQAGVRVPDDVAVTGFDDIPFAALANPRLTTVATPTVEMGRRAALALIAAIAERRPAPAVVMPVALVVRESTTGAAETHA